MSYACKTSARDLKKGKKTDVLSNSTCKISKCFLRFNITRQAIINNFVTVLTNKKFICQA